MDLRVSFSRQHSASNTALGMTFLFKGRAQYGMGFNFSVYQGRYQYGQGFGDVLRGLWRFFRQVAHRGAQTLLKTGGDALKDGATLKEVISNTQKPTIDAVFGATAEQVANRLTSETPTAAPPPGPLTSHPESVYVGTKATGQH